ncbi:MAG: type I DNA topoisomerase, partial [Chloroflexi bacterium]|nr:type I DNA topoisomerase [Chloroflexota bacterium]
VDREREIEAFVPQEYWALGARLARPGADGVGPAPFQAALHSHLGSRQRLEVSNGATASAIAADLRAASYRVLDVRHRDSQRQPPPPFITSTIQQEAWRKLRYSAKRTMALAQQLYEGVALGAEGPVGLITYMRTDSVHVAAAAKQEARDYIRQRFGADYLPPHPRTHTQKAKGAQEAHEAIRPTSMLREPAALKDFLTADQLRLYELVWKRMLASQMAVAVIATTTVDVAAAGTPSAQGYLLRASGSTVKFPGFIALYTEGRDEAGEEEGQPPLPDLAPAEPLRLLEVLSEQKFTQPPPRYTEATLVKALEENGIGRPSTYAPTVATIQDRDYVRKEEGRLMPSGLGKLVSDLLTKHFADIMDLGFTATMEEDLDEIAQGKRPWAPVVQEFYQPFARDLKEAEKSLSHAALGEAEPVCECTGSPKCKHVGPCGKPMTLKESRWKSKFWGCTGYPDCRSTKSLRLQEAKAALEEPTDQVCEKCGKPMVIKTGRYGRFLACTGYPDCKNTKPIVVGTGVKCPKDGGELLQRKSRKGKTFYSCSNYPQCDFSLGARPLPQPCPHCGSLRIAFRRGGARCTVCNKPSRVAAKREEPEAVGAA